MSAESNPLSIYLEQIAERSLRGEIPWVRIAMTVLGARRMTPSGEKLLTIQMSEPKGGDFFGGSPIDYLLQVSTAQDKKIELSLSTTSRPELRDSLARVYAAAKASEDVETSRILSELVAA